MTDGRAELRELMAQAAEHLRYLRELGIETVGEARPPESGSQSEAGMKKEKAAAEAPSLFGEIAAPPIEEKYGAETLEDIQRRERCLLRHETANEADDALIESDA